MSDIPRDVLKREILSILLKADLSVISAKKVREQIEQKFNCSLLKRKKEFDALVMECMSERQDCNDSGDESAESEEEESSSEEERKTKKNTPAHAVKRSMSPSSSSSAKKQRKSQNSADSASSDSDASDEDSDYKAPKKAKSTKKTRVKSEGSSGRKATPFTRALDLSPELSAVVGAEQLPRHEVVRKVWALIKERNLYDPKNKQFAICDDELMNVMKVKRFRIFGMLKHLKPHFITK